MRGRCPLGEGLLDPFLLILNKKSKMSSRSLKEKQSPMHVEQADGYSSSDAEKFKDETNIEKAPGDLTLDPSLNDWTEKEEKKLV